MVDFLVWLSNTPIPNLLIIAGFIFLLLGIVRRVEGRFEVPPELQRPSLVLGLAFVILGLLLNYTSGAKSPAVTAQDAPTSTPTTQVNVPETPATTPVSVPTNRPIKPSIEVVDRGFTGDGVIEEFSELLADDEIIVGEAYTITSDKLQDDVSNKQGCIVFLILGPGSFTFKIESGGWRKYKYVRSGSQAEQVLEGAVKQLIGRADAGCSTDKITKARLHE